uniref:Putative secreted protein n=1 Tax=Anopheles darlingi TaxID=43151 RepID=A0A2M4DMW6_ANODA
MVRLFSFFLLFLLHLSWFVFLAFRMLQLSRLSWLDRSIRRLDRVILTSFTLLRFSRTIASASSPTVEL